MGRAPDDKKICAQCGTEYLMISGSVDHQTGLYYCARCTVARHLGQEEPRQRE